MKNVRFFANVVKTVAAIAVFGLSFVGCQKDDLADHSNKEEGKAKLTITDEPKPTPTPVYRDSSWVKVSHDTITIVVEHFRNDTLINADSTKCNFGASIKRVENKLQTTEARLANLDFSFGEVTTSRNGKNQFVGKQQVTDEDGQTYNGELLSGYCTFGSLSNIHAELVSFKKTNLQNTDLEPGKDEAKLVNTDIAWNYVVSIVNAPNLAGQEFELTTNNTEHERYILKNAPEFVKYGDWKVWKETGNWNTVWRFECNEYWSNDSVAPKSKLTTLKGSYSRKNLDDKTVSNLADYTHPEGTLVWGDWYDVESKDTGVTLREKKGTKKSLATNGFDADKFDTEFSVTMQEADVMFCDSLFHVSSDEATLTNQRNVFLDEDSDRDGYQMVRFTDTELAQWAGQYDQKLDESCKLYLKVATPAELDEIEFVGTKVHTEGMAKIDGSVIPVFTDGTKGGAISFKWEKAESWTWLKDSVIFNDVNFVMEETGKLTLKGEESKTAKTFATDNENITIKCNEYTADFQTTVKVDGGIKYTTWRAVWYEDFKVVYSGKEASLAKSSYSVKNQNDKLSKDEARSNATSEVWGYSVEGIFSIDEDSRSAYGYGRLTKAIEEKIIRTYWDETSKGQSHTVLESTRWATLVREYNTGKKTTQEYKHVFNRMSGTSKWEITAEEGSEAAANALILENANEENRADDFAHFTLKKFELGQYFDVPGAAQQHDKVTFTESMGAYFEAKDQDGNAIKIFFEDPSYSFTNDVKSLTVKSENESETVYQHENVVNWSFGGAMTQVSATGLIHVAKSTPVTPDFDIEVDKIYSTVSRPSNRSGVDGDITAYTYLLVSKDGKKCLPIGIYHDVVTTGEITDMESGFNSACYEKNENKVVATRCELVDGIIQYYRHATGYDAVDAGMFMKWQAAGFNNRGNSFENWQHMYAPHAEEKNGVTEVRFDGTNVSYTFKGWNV